MFGLIVLVSIVTHFVTGINVTDIAKEPSNIILETSFSSVNGLVVGSPVTVRGELVGEVLKIENINKNKNKNQSKQPNSFNVQISLRDSGSVTSSAIALIATPMNPTGVKQQAVVEILLPAAASKKQFLSDKIRGFSSYKEFWLAADIKTL